MWKGICWGLDPRALVRRSVVAGDVPSWATRSTGSRREGVLLSGVAVCPHGWVMPVCRVGMGAGWVWEVFCPTTVPATWWGLYPLQVPWEAVLVWFCTQPSFNQYCIKCKRVFEHGSLQRWPETKVPDLDCGGGKLQSKGLVCFLRFPDYVAESAFPLHPR